MVCTTLTVTKPQPVVTVVPGTTGFAKGGAYLNGDCTVPFADVETAMKEYAATIQVSDAAAKFKLRFDWNKDGVAGSFTSGILTQSIGQILYFLQDIYTYSAGTYSGLSCTVLDVTPA